MSQASMIGVAGVYYVAAYVSGKLGCHAAPTFRNVPDVDLLVSAPGGGRSVAVQVKTSSCAWRGPDREHATEYQWSIGDRSSTINRDDLLFALVDLAEFAVTLPDVWIVPSKVIFKYFEGRNPATWKWARYHVKPPDIIAKYRNELGWDLLKKKLEM